MKFVKRSDRSQPRVSLVLLDWGVRESFHLLHYLERQTVPRDTFEVILVEYYSNVSAAAQHHADQIDTWVLLEMPEETYYHKHLMYNVGIEFAKGEIVMIGDSDAMVREGFIAAILDAFDRDPEIVFHMDQFRNVRRDLYPFNYPSFETVLGEGCINNVGGRTAGVVEKVDPLHMRNYGACMCARRADLIAIAGADEHIDYLGHICGPYDMTFRLINLGRREVWADDEFTYHTWHPGQAGVDNYLGPHDGRHMSTTALRALLTGRTMPLVENDALRARRLGTPLTQEEATRRLIRPEAATAWSRALLEERAPPVCAVDSRFWVATHCGARVYQDGTRFVVEGGDTAAGQGEGRVFATVTEAFAAIEAGLPRALRWRLRIARYAGHGIRTAARAAQLVGHPSGLAALRRRLLGGTGGASACGSSGAWSDATDFANLVAAYCRATSNGSGRPELVVLNRSNALALHLMMAAGLLPRTAVRVVSDTAAAGALAQAAGSRPMILQGMAYTRYYPLLRSRLGAPLSVA